MFLFFFLSILGLRQWLARIMPQSLVLAVGAGIGLFIACVPKPPFIRKCILTAHIQLHWLEFWRSWGYRRRHCKPRWSRRLQGGRLCRGSPWLLCSSCAAKSYNVAWYLPGRVGFRNTLFSLFVCLQPHEIPTGFWQSCWCCTASKVPFWSAYLLRPSSLGPAPQLSRTSPTPLLVMTCSLSSKRLSRSIR